MDVRKRDKNRKRDSSKSESRSFRRSESRSIQAKKVKKYLDITSGIKEIDQEK